MAEPAAATLGGLMSRTRRALAAAGIEEAPLDARLIVMHAAGVGLTELVADPQRPVEAAVAAATRAAAARRAAGEPVHRIVGRRAFYGLELALSPDTLEPRPDTETLVDLVLPAAEAIAARTGVCDILDLGTGSGAIALALLSRLPQARAVGLDICEGALATARANADMNGCGDRFETCRSDWFAAVNRPFHIIVSNPPYVRSIEWAGLSREVREHDPKRALDGGVDGLDAYRRIAAEADRFLIAGGRLAVEFGHDQQDAVAALFQAHGFEALEARRDLGGRPRAALFARRKDLESM
ncbi:peptide chain release factor N(5)-glutamine methyltransferase [Aquibium sp. A9E412]|uniref:peptide chain release factor N(5)-glutamine methyltransferase n=1 Tax=Aquibium sp. A9E412 TaxID=2976767 RepID=UPI0025AFFEAE|nr:peptide chain release factor N(5)-glutamine methyltransferase [Aquibium sp. A9E412]MDN2566977.1 peptide chain release factor N(5)-glutamine methyltransferase [Aquibium sp. A9E412]